MIPIVHRYRFPEDWPGKSDPDQPKNPVMVVDSVKLHRLGDGEELDLLGSEQEIDEGDLYLVMTLRYGCSHTKFPNLGRWGQWYCGEMGCPHYLGKKEAAE